MRKARNFTCKRCGKDFSITYGGYVPKYCGTKCANRAKAMEFDVKEAMRLYESGLSVEKVATALGVTAGPVYRAFRGAGFQRRQKNVGKGYDQSGSNNPRWKGGRHESNGYIKVIRHGHPRADKTGRVFEHIVVMEEYLGRHLVWLGGRHPDSEVVHHKNHDRTDNRLENLEVMTNREHWKHHQEKRENDEMRSVRVKMPRAIFERIDAVATAQGSSQTAVILEYIKQGLERDTAHQRAFVRPTA